MAKSITSEDLLAQADARDLGPFSRMILELLAHDPNYVSRYNQQAQARASLPDYAAFLRPAFESGLSNVPILATMQGELARQGALQGLDPGIAEAVATSPALQTIRDAFAFADALDQTRSDVNIITAGGMAAVPEAPGLFETTLGGAAAGAAVGGPIGAAVGGLGGLISGQSGQRKEREAKEEVQERSDAAFAAMSPEGVSKTLAGLTPAIREQALAGGYGGLAGQELQAAISRSGLRDSALGSLGGVAAAVAPEQAARSAAIRQGLASTRRQVENILRAPVRQPGRDRLTEALGATAEGFLLYKSLFPTKTQGSASLLPGPEDLFNTERPQFEIPNADEFALRT